MTKTYTVNNTQEAKKVILNIIMAEVRKKVGNKPIKINIVSDTDERRNI